LSQVKQAALYVVLVLCIFALLIIGHPRVTKGLIPKEIKTYLNAQTTLREQFSSKQRAPSETDINNHDH
jgi:multidrug efflux pump subunit AcrB